MKSTPTTTKYDTAFEEANTMISEKDFYGAQKLLLNLPKAYGASLSESSTSTLNKLKANEEFKSAIKLRGYLYKALSKYKYKTMSKAKITTFLKKIISKVPETKTARMAQEALEKLQK